MHLVSVKIHRYKGLAAGTELVFGAGPVFLLGKNGAGKTTLLELLAALARFDFEWLERQGELDVEWEAGLTQDGWGDDSAEGPLTVRCRVRTARVSAGMSSAEGGPDAGLTAVPGRADVGRAEGVDVPGADVPTTAEVELVGAGLRFSMQARAGWVPAVFVADAAVPVRDGAPYRLRDGARALPALLSLAYRTDVSAAVRATASVWFDRLSSPALALASRFPEALDYFGWLVIAGDRHANVGAAFEVRAQGVALTRGIVPVVPYHTPRMAPRRLHGLPVWPSDSLEFDDCRGLLGQVATALGARAVSAKADPRREWPDGTREYAGFVFRVAWPDGSSVRHDELSFGQKRLLSFCWYVDCLPDGPLFVDELTNGLHYDWVQMLVEALDGRQVFHAVQNPLLLDFTGPGAEGEVAGRFVLCGVEVGPEGRKWTWRNPTPEEAARLFRACAVGIQSVSEVLWSQGLW